MQINLHSYNIYPYPPIFWKKKISQYVKEHLCRKVCIFGIFYVSLQHNFNTMKRIIIEISNEQLLSNCEEIVIKVRDTINNGHHQDIYFCRYIQGLIRNWEEKKHYRTAETYQSAMNSFMEYRSGEDILLSDIDRKVMEDYEKFLISRGIVKNSSSFYMRIIRAVYNRAVDENIIEDLHPFKHVYTGIDNTDKRAIDLTVIKAIKNFKSRKASVLFARDMFMFSFYTRGMSFVDMAHLLRTNLTNGYLTYRRQKTGTLLKIRWEPQIQEILNVYQRDTSPYLLPILTTGTHAVKKKKIHASQRKINRNLKRIAKDLGLDINLTMYVARHSWASIARKMQIPISVISDGMGHNSERTTRIYLKTMDTTPIDNANRLIMDTLDE